MKKSIFLAPSGKNVGLTSTSLGLVHALDQAGLKVGFAKPVAQYNDDSNGCDPSISFLKTIYNIETPKPISLADAQEAIAQGDIDHLMERVVDLCRKCAQEADVLVVEGLVIKDNSPFVARINSEIITTLDSHIVLVAAQNDLSFSEFNRHLTMTSNYYSRVKRSNLLGFILNKIGTADKNYSLENFEEITEKIVNAQSLYCLGRIPWQEGLIEPRVLDVQRHLGASLLHEDGDLNRRVHNITICACSVANAIHSLVAHTLVVVPGDRDDIILSVCMAALNGVPIAGLVLTVGLTPSPEFMALCQTALSAGLPVLCVTENTIETAKKLEELSKDVPADDIPRAEKVTNFVAEHINGEWVAEQLRIDRQKRLSPASFRYQLVERARQRKCRIILPESSDPRTLRAAVICHEKAIARCVLLGDPQEIRDVAEKNSIVLPNDIEILDKNQSLDRYIDILVEKRKHKNLGRRLAASQLEDPVVLATLMLALDEVDGLVSGAVNTTANTIRPALQLIKTSEEAKLVSSVFFMCLPDQVLVYGDCAVNTNPSAEELADIAVQSSDSAKAFGIEPRVAMISYSTGVSGSGADVEKVCEATRLAKERCPDLIIDGPLQYDAAFDSNVAQKKAPSSQVAGKATVFVFPDLNTGNTTYKAVQRSANVVSIGPMLQGLRKPVNDLSRGALVEDIVYTIALTAVQANSNFEFK